MNFQPFHIANPTNELPDGVTTTILENSNAISYHTTLPEYNATPMVELSNLAQDLGIGNLFVKDESKRFRLNAFKVLGASFAVHQVLQNDSDVNVFCTATDGNHGRAVAWSASKYSKSAVVFVPRNTSNARQKAIQLEGADVFMLDMDYDGVCEHAHKESEKNGWCYLQDRSAPGYEKIPAMIMAGYQTMFYEIMNSDASDIDIVFLQVGVGSFAASAAWHYLHRFGMKRPKIILVEPTESDGMFQSFLKNTLEQPSGSLNTIMAGLNCGVPSSTAWEILKSAVDALMVIPDSYAREAMKVLFRPIGKDPSIISGESGAAGLAGLLALTHQNYKPLSDYLGISDETKVLCINTEGNTDPDSFQKIVDDL